MARVAGVAALAWLAFGVALLAVRGGDLSRFVLAGDFFADASRVPAGLHVRPDSHGYDGQFFYRIALDPWTDREEDFGIVLDRAPYRQQRILYPLLARGLAAGVPEALPAALVLVNGLALVLLGGLGAAWARRAGVDPWTGLAFSLQPGLALAFARDLAEPVEAATVVAGLWLLRTPRAAWAGLALALAVLARETAILVAGAVFLAWLPRGAWPARLRPDGARPPASAWAAPLAVWLAWQAWLAAHWEIPFLVGVAARGVRKSGLAVFDRLAGALGGEGPAAALTSLEIAGLLALAAGLLAGLRRSRAEPVEKLAALLLGALLFTRGESVWIEDQGFLRLSAGFTTLALAVLAQAPGAAARRAPGIVVAAWLGVAAHALTRP